MAKALDAAFEYLMSLEDKEFRECLNEYAQGDIAQAMIELGAAKYEWEQYLKGKWSKEPKILGQDVMNFDMESFIVTKMRMENLFDKNQYKKQALNLRRVSNKSGHFEQKYDMELLVA
ncbi:MAG: hypothetical protein Q9M37_01215 [Desulfonauticus sp.]|nr:hypothetical protein [Desulfonauticus sp.]